MKKNLLLLSAIVYLGCLCMITQSFLCSPRSSFLYAILDTPLQAHSLLRNWRTTHPPFLDSYSQRFNLRGLENLNISGSGQFNEESYRQMIKKVKVRPCHFFVLDLREESHGLINGLAVSWLEGEMNYGNKGKTLIEIEADEQTRLQNASHKGKIVVKGVDEKSIEMTVEKVATERELVESFGHHYVRFPVTDHNRPSDEVLDQFILFIKALPKNSWIHFHCKAGKGRTTTFMAIYDMIFNAAYIDFQDILARQQLIGGTDLRKIDKPELYKRQPAIERLAFLKEFYLYCREVPQLDKTWSEWKAGRQAIVFHP